LLEALNPQAILRRGYAIVRGGDGKSLRSARKLKTGDIVEVQLSDGTFGASVTGKGK
jgi:exodeoxyribonuclease VII large subunit